MQLNILYFARLREALGRGSETVVAPAEVRTLGELRDWLAARGDPWRAAFAEVQPLRAALDQAVAGDEARLRDGAEVAFFPPVTGG
jgi:sulfur-carrier protein